MDSGDPKSAESAGGLPEGGEGGVERRDTPVPGRGDELEELLRDELAPELEVLWAE